MNDFLLNLWSDLREKRLWPVAIALAVGLVAVPIVLKKPAETPAPAATSVPAPTDPAVGQPLPAALEAAQPLLRTSTLNEFNSENPFKPLKALKKVELAAGVEPTTSDKSSSSTDTGGTAGGDTTGGDTTGGGTPPVQTQEKKVFTYQAVVEVTTASGVNKRNVDRLGILPSDRNPLLVFLGVSADDQGEAVFLVDSTVTQAGEGRCRPSRATCSFLYLTGEDGQDEHIFTTDDGKEVGIKLIAIRRVQVKESQAPVGGAPNANAGGAATADFTAGGAGSADVAATDVSTDPTAADEATEATETGKQVKEAFEGFSFPLFADEEE